MILQQHLAVHHNLRLLDRLSSYDLEEEPIVWETVLWFRVVIYQRLIVFNQKLFMF